MSDLLPEIPRPSMSTASWRERLADWAESLDLSPTRLVVGGVVLVVAGIAAWRLLAPTPLPTEMAVPFASSSSARGGAGVGSSGAGAEPHVSGSGSTRPTEVVVHVAGAVARPGVQRLGGTARVVDAVDAAGGANPDADLAQVNLAAPLEDGQQIYVPRLGEAVSPPAAAGRTADTADGSAARTGPVNLNTADVAELEELPGVGPAIAQAIVDHRERIGPFSSVEELLDVRGIGEARLEQLRDLVTV